jgi:hypothetical protein
MKLNRSRGNGRVVVASPDAGRVELVGRWSTVIKRACLFAVSPFYTPDCLKIRNKMILPKNREERGTNYS